MCVEGNANVLAALGDLGVRRYLLQSSGFWCAPGAGLADEATPFIVDASPGVAAGARTYIELEARASRTRGLEFVALRYGFFYGPGTWYRAEGDMGEYASGRFWIIGAGEGVSSFVHIEDAASATAAALESAPGAYNIVDDRPSKQRLWLPAFARACWAPEPLQITEQEALATSGADSVYYAMCLRGASKRESQSHVEFSSQQTGVALATWLPQRKAAAL